MIAWLLAGPEHVYQVPLPAPGEPKRAILDTYTKEHSAEYQSQALIDLARRLREQIGDLDQIATIVMHTSHHTHYVIGTGSGRPAEIRPRRVPGDARSLDDVHLRRRATGRHVASRALLCTRTRTPAGHGRAVAQDLHRRRPGVDPPLPLDRPGGEGVRGACRGDPDDGEVLRTSSPSPTLIRWAPGRSSASSTSASSPHSPTAWSIPPSSSASWTPCSRCRPPERRRPRRAERAGAARRAGQGADHSIRDLPVRACSAAASSAADKRARVSRGTEFRSAATLPGCVLAAGRQLVAEIGFDGVYVSGAALSADLGLPDIGLTTLTEVPRGAHRSRRSPICRR